MVPSSTTVLGTVRSGVRWLFHDTQDLCGGATLECTNMAMFDLSLDELREYRPKVDEPPDFDDFWRDTIDTARGFDLGDPSQPLRLRRPAARKPCRRR